MVTVLSERHVPRLAIDNPFQDIPCSVQLGRTTSGEKTVLSPVSFDGLRKVGFVTEVIGRRGTGAGHFQRTFQAFIVRLDSLALLRMKPGQKTAHLFAGQDVHSVSALGAPAGDTSEVTGAWKLMIIVSAPQQAMFALCYVIHVMMAGMFG